jgi:hypothetical protein
MDEAEVMRRIQAVKTLRYPPSTRVVEIDADQPLDRVLDRAKRSIWREL